MPASEKERGRGESGRGPAPERGELSSQATVAADSAPASARADDDSLPPGSSFGEYQIVEPLGRGGMGIVYRCRHRTLDRAAALKILNVRARGGGTAGEARFLREARSAAQLDHHNVVTIYNAGQYQGLLFIEMQLVDGRPLSALIANGPLDPMLATRYVEQIAHALQHAHGRGVIHRDIKPDNVLVTADGLVKVTDFGLAKQSLADTALTAPGSIMGTPIYMAPEQWQGEPTDARTDLYALGVTYYQLLVGAPPYAGKLADLLRLHTEGAVPLAHHANPAVPAAMSEVAARLMAKRPADRYQRAADLVVDLRRLQRPETSPPAPDAVPAAEKPPAETACARPPGAERVGEPVRPATTRRPRGLAAALALALAVAAAGLGLHASGVARGLELRLLDRRMLARDAPASSRVALVAFDEESARRLGNPPRRDAIADLIQVLEAAGARALAVDLYVTDPDPGLADGALCDATGEARRLVHALDLHEPERRTDAPPPDPALARFAIPGLAADGLPAFARAAAPFPKLLARTRALGHAIVEVDHDGVVRRIPLLAAHGGRVFPSLALALLLLAERAAPGDVRFAPGGPIRIAPAGRPPLEILVDREARLTLSARGGLDRFPRHSFAGLLEQARAGKPLGESFRGKIVLLGNWHAGQADLQPMPGLPAAPLVLAHAMAIETMLARDFVRTAGPATVALLVLGLALLGVALGRFLPLPYPFLAAPLVLVGLFVLATILLARGGLAIPMLAPGGALVAAVLSGGALRAWSERRALRRLSQALGRYLPRRVAQRILDDPSALRLGGKRKELTVLYAELQEFAVLSDQLEPEEVGELLERFFAVTGEAVTRHGGTLDRFNGDGVRAFFGDPLPLEDHAARAVRCALEIEEEVRRGIDAWAVGGRPRPRLGIGLSTGYVTVGNIGTLQRMEYTVLGRHVELAEELARRARDGVLVSGRTRALAPDLRFRPRGEAFEPERSGSPGPRPP